MLAQELLAHANAELNTRRKALIKPDLHSDYKHLCSASIPVTAELFADDLSKQVKDISEVNRVGRKVTSTMPHHLPCLILDTNISPLVEKENFPIEGTKKHFLG